MSNVKIAKIHTDLVSAFKTVGKEFADKIKKEYNLTELFVPDTVASQIVAGSFLGKRKLNFRVRKTGLNKGILEITNY